jgi:type III restriction enzyme
MPRRTTRDANPAAEAPVQAPVDEPILNSPYEEPKLHWLYDKSGVPTKTAGRRRATYWWTTVRTGSQQMELEGVGTDFGGSDLPLINKLREDLAKWRNSKYEGATPITRQLLRHWWDPARARRLFFCQIEAVETVIYLHEILGSGRRPRWNAAVTREDYEKMLKGEKPDLAAELTEDAFPSFADQPIREDYKPLIRQGCKMATGSGKTVVMSMLIAWAFCNRARVPGDERFPSAILVLCPNLTVKERLQVLRTDAEGESYYAKFDIVPAVLRPLISHGRVLVSNWHSLAPESPHAEGGENYKVVDKGEEGDDAFSRRILGDLYGRGPILVLNDEAHHAWRPKPEDEAESSRRRVASDELVGGADAEERREATVWIDGLDRLNNSVGVRACIDLSATPFYLDGTGHIPGSPFPWLVSDFGLIDAIESGITKIPRLPVSDDTGRPDPRFFRLWEDIKGKCSPAQLRRGKPVPEAVWIHGEAALRTLASQWKERFDYHQSARQGQNFIPPVIIVVCDNTDIAQLFFEKISGETEEEELVAGRGGKQTKRKVKRYNPTGAIFEELANTEQTTRTLRIDTKLLGEAEAGEGSTKQKEAEKLRELIACVGVKGTPGEQIRCVVSVQMLTEGWDANNVTQILGLRAFGSQLLCEQVVGRGLRRMSYEIDPTTGKLSPEYADVFGIPFSVIPFKGRPKDRPEPDDKPQTLVKALTQRSNMEMSFPIVDSFVTDMRRTRIRCDVEKLPELVITTTENPVEVFVMPQVGVRFGNVGKLNFETATLDREQFYAAHSFQTTLFEISRLVVNILTDQSAKDPAVRNMSRAELFPQVLKIVEEYAEKRVVWNGVNKRELALERYTRPFVDRLVGGIEPVTPDQEPPVLPVINRFKTRGSTEEVHFVTTRPTHPTIKSQIDQVVLDTDTWERSVAFQLESSAHVAFYARNDHLELSIPYEFLGVSHAFFPDFIVRLVNGLTLVLEVKGMVDEQQRAKFSAAERWIRAVNYWGKMGRWDFLVCKDPNSLRQHLEHYAKESMTSPQP